MTIRVNRAGAILAVSDFQASLAFYRDKLGFEVQATFDEPPYAILVSGATRISLAEQGHPADDLPGRGDDRAGGSLPPGGDARHRGR